MNAAWPLLFLFCAHAALAAAEKGKCLTLEVEAVDGTGDDPMMMVWLETTAGDFVKTLHVFSKDKKWYKDMTVWSKAREGAADPIDAVIGPTIKWGSQRAATIPVQASGIDLLSGAYQIHIEQRRDKGGHYKKVRIALPADFSRATIEDEGYIKRLNLSVKAQP